MHIGTRIQRVMKERGVTPLGLALHCGVTQGAVSNWFATGRIRKDNLVKVAEMLQVRTDDLISGAIGEHDSAPLQPMVKPTDWTPPQHTATGVIVPSVAHDLSHPKFEDAPTTIAWECILTEQLKSEFQTVMPDASMEPDVPRGARVIFITGAEPVPGDWVLCADSDDNLYLREMRQHKPGRWEAHALNQAFLPLDSERDKLRVVAVFDGVRGRKGWRG